MWNKKIQEETYFNKKLWVFVIVFHLEGKQMYTHILVAYKRLLFASCPYWAMHIHASVQFMLTPLDPQRSALILSPGFRS